MCARHLCNCSSHHVRLARQLCGTWWRDAPPWLRFRREQPRRHVTAAAKDDFNDPMPVSYTNDRLHAPFGLMSLSAVSQAQHHFSRNYECTLTVTMLLNMWVRGLCLWLGLTVTEWAHKPLTDFIECSV